MSMNSKKLIAGLAALPVLAVLATGPASSDTTDYPTICDKKPEACGSTVGLPKPHVPTLPPAPTKPSKRIADNGTGYSPISNAKQIRVILPNYH